MSLTVTIDASDQQMLALALAKLSLERPGWKDALGELAARFSFGPHIEDGRMLFERFREMYQDTPPAVGWGDHREKSER